MMSRRNARGPVLLQKPEALELKEKRSLLIVTQQASLKRNVVFSLIGVKMVLYFDVYQKWGLKHPPQTLFMEGKVNLVVPVARFFGRVTISMAHRNNDSQRKKFGIIER